jgi:hypothetical protein
MVSVFILLLLFIQENRILPHSFAFIVNNLRSCYCHTVAKQYYNKICTTEII